MIQAAVSILFGLASASFLLAALEIRMQRFDLTATGLFFLSLALALGVALVGGAGV